MNDKKFDEIMHKYVSSKKQGMDADFSKLNEIKEKRTAKKNKSRLIWATVSCFIVIAVTLSVVLPLTLPSKNEDDGGSLSNIQYFEAQDIELKVVEGKEDITSKYNITASLPTINNQCVGYSIICNRANDYIIGTYIELEVFDEYFDSIKMYIISENNVVYMLAEYDALPYESKWGNNNIKYLIDHDEDWDCNNIMLFFVLDGYKYYLDAQYYGDLNVEEVLDLIF